jgi:hypothetical protein
VDSGRDSADAAVTFLEIQNELLPTGVGNTARFKETQRASVKRWINDRYAEAWGLEDWTFRKAASTVTVTAGSNVLAAPADLGIVLGLFNDQGTRIAHISPTDYFDRHLGPVVTSDPSVHTIINKQILLDPTPGTTSSAWELYYEKALTLLVNDGDVPQLPVEHHFMLVHGAEATGQTRMNDFTYQFSEQRWQNQLAAMRRNYLADKRGSAAGTKQWADALGG